MTDRTDALAQALFQKPTLQACSLQQVDYLAHQYPYFNAAQLLLLQKTEPHSEAYHQQLQQVALHTSHPLQLQFWLQPDGFGGQHAQPQLFQTPIPEEPTVESAPQTDLAEIHENISEPEAETLQDLSEIETEPVEETREEAPEIVSTANEVAEVKEPDTATQLASTEGIEPKTAALQPATRPEPELSAITFEPYHTVDYFASQGIRLSQQEAGNDKLGKQLKSFTEWLRTMKRLPETAVAQTSDATSERNVENLAAHSLDTADVVTESMAEVWLKQGNREKAAEVYRKLSLHYPAKSAYFAAKIDALK